MNRIRNERGFLMLDVIFLMLITALAATILINAAPRAKNPQSTIRLIALHLANEQFAMLESKAAAGENLPENFLGKDADLENVVTFNVETTVTGTGNLRKVKVKVSWSDEDKDCIEVEKTILFVPKENP
ncbi:MAG: type II secretion system protein [Selenomonadaceae bacterium]|nr:type II secretion system protein [Selenomonadaceae bacterium]